MNLSPAVNFVFWVNMMNNSKPPRNFQEGKTPSPTIPHTGKNFRATHAALLIAILLAAGIIIYSNAFHASMVLDDHQFIINNNPVHMTDFTWEGIKTAALQGHPRYRYLPKISFAVNYYFGKLNPVGYHMLNLAIHLLTGIFLFFFFRATLRIHPARHTNISPETIAFFAALIWIVQPLGSQAVTYICQRMASMVAMFYILSLLLYVKGRMAMIQNPEKSIPPVFYFAGCATAALCALATKQNAGTLPLIILSYEWFFFQDLKLRWSRRQFVWGGFFIIGFFAAVIWFMGENPLHRILNSYTIRDFTLIERVMTQWRIVIYYISLFFWAPPGRLNLDHHYPLSVSPLEPATTLPALFAIIGLFVLAIYAARKERLMAFAIFWFFITQATESTIIGIELIFEHRTYIPFMMISLMVVMVGFRMLTPGLDREGIKPSPAAAKAYGGYALLGMMVLLFSFWTYHRNADWSNPVRFWTDCVHKSPTKWRPNYNLAKTLYDAGGIDAAIVQYEKTHHLHPEDVHSLNNLANILLEKGKPDQAIRYLRTALEIDPKDPAANVNLGNALMKKGMINKAVHQYQIALNLNPNQKEIYMNLGKGLARKNNREAAINIYGRGVALFPDYPELRLELANAMAQGGKPADALYHYEILQRNTPIAPLAVKNKKTVLATLSPGDQVKTLFNTAVRFVSGKNFTPAIGLLREILIITPENALIYYNIACLYALSNQKKEAVDWLGRAVEKGYTDWDHLKTDPDLDNIRNTPEYKKLEAQRGKLKAGD